MAGMSVREAVEATLHGKDERLVARYVGAPDVVSFNRSILRRSLESIQLERLRTAPFDRSRRLDLVTGPFLLPAGPPVQLPAGWRLARGVPTTCFHGLSPTSWIDASPPGDFTVTVGLVWWRDLDLEQLANRSACDGTPVVPGYRS